MYYLKRWRISGNADFQEELERFLEDNTERLIPPGGCVVYGHHYNDLEKLKITSFLKGGSDRVIAVTADRKIGGVTFKGDKVIMKMADKAVGFI